MRRLARLLILLGLSPLCLAQNPGSPAVAFISSSAGNWSVWSAVSGFGSLAVNPGPAVDLYCSASPGVWQPCNPSSGGGGSVTSVTITGANGIGTSGCVITTSGTCALSLGAITPSSVTTGISNVTYYPASCGSLSPAPAWCAGSDLGAWINAAYAAGTSPVNISIDPGAYSFTTPIALNTVGKYASIQWNGDATYTPSTGTALTLTSGGGATAHSVIYNMVLRTAASGSTAIGLANGDGTTNADYTRLVNPTISGFKTLVADNSYGLEIDNPNLQPCSSATGSVGVNMANAGDDLKVIGGLIASCLTNVHHANGNALSLTQTIIGDTVASGVATTNDVLVDGGGVFKCVLCHWVNPAGNTAHWITNNGLFNNDSPHFENDATTGSSATPIVNTGVMSNHDVFSFSAGQTYTNFIDSTLTGWNGTFTGFVQDIGGRISDAYTISTRGDRQIILSNPDFENSNIIPPPGWIPVGTSVVPSYETSTQAPNKTQSLKFTAGSQFAGLEYMTAFSVVAGDTYSLQCAMKSDGTSSPNCVVQFQTNTGGFVGNLSVSTASTSWVTQSATATVPATAVKAVVFLQNNTAAGAGTSFFDQVSIQKTNFNSPTFVTPTLGVATATSINKVAITAPATSATLTLANSSTLTLNGAFNTQFTGSANATFTLPGATTTLAGASNNLSFFSATSSAQLAGVLSDETGTGVAVFSASPALTGTPTAPTASANTSSTQLATTAFVTSATGISSAISTNVGGTGISAVTCSTAACTNLRGTYTMTASTVSAGTVVTLVWPTTTTAYACWALQNGGVTALGVGHSVATATGMTLSVAVAVASGSITIDYGCQP